MPTPSPAAPASSPKNPVYTPPPVPQGGLPPIDPATVDAQTPDKTAPEPPNMAVKSRNEALVYLAQHHGCAPEDMKKLKTKADVIEFAKEKFNLVFPSWE